MDHLVRDFRVDRSLHLVQLLRRRLRLIRAGADVRAFDVHLGRGDGLGILRLLALLLHALLHLLHLLVGQDLRRDRDGEHVVAGVLAASRGRGERYVGLIVFVVVVIRCCNRVVLLVLAPCTASSSA